MKAWWTHDRLEAAAGISFLVFAAGIIVSGWQAGWPAEETQMQGWAMAVVVPAFLLGIGFQVAAAFRKPEEKQENGDGTAAVERSSRL